MYTTNKYNPKLEQEHLKYTANDWKVHPCYIANAYTDLTGARYEGF